MGGWAKLAPIGSQRTGCLNCPPKPAVAPLDWQPHPGFGLLALSCDGEAPEWWAAFCDWPTEPYTFGSWESGEIKAGPRKGQEWHGWIGGEIHWSLAESVTLRDIEECAAADPNHDWRLTSEGPLGGVVYQRHADATWVAVEKLDGFA